MLKRRWQIILIVTALAVGVGGYGYFKYGKTSLENAINPGYWIKRARGEDMYNPSTRMLMHGNHQLKEVALTIDDGPHSPTCEQILDILKAHNIHATFFVVGMRMKEHPDLVRQMIAEGHEVANHTQNHYRLSTLRPDQARREINDCDINFFRITGRHFSLLRPPGIRYNQTVLRIADELGYVIVDEDVAAKDFEDVTPDFIVNRVERRVENGSIILLHDDRPGTIVALPRILDELQREGYRFVTISEMLEHLPHPVHVDTAGKSVERSVATAGNLPRKSIRTLGSGGQVG